jgi:hypothetical protein
VKRGETANGKTHGVGSKNGDAITAADTEDPKPVGEAADPVRKVGVRVKLPSVWA